MSTPPSDIEMAQIKRACLKLAEAIDGLEHAVALTAIEVFVASAVIDSGIELEQLVDGIRQCVGRMQARAS